MAATVVRQPSEVRCPAGAGHFSGSGYLSKVVTRDPLQTEAAPQEEHHFLSSFTSRFLCKIPQGKSSNVDKIQSVFVLTDLVYSIKI